MKVLGLDPSLANTGCAVISLSPDDFRPLQVEELKLIETKKTKHKQVRKNSDDLRRAQEILRTLESLIADHRISLAFAEMPVGSLSARSSWALGIALGVVAHLAERVPLIQVMPEETKCATGKPNASKAEMIAWAVSSFPTANWLTRQYKGKREVLAKNEHLADAVAVVHAGIQTDEFRRLAASLATMKRPASMAGLFPG